MSKGPAAKDATPPTTEATSAEKQARKVQQAQDGAKAWAEYKDREAATRERTAKLREQRLAREAKDAAAKKNG